MQRRPFILAAIAALTTGCTGNLGDVSTREEPSEIWDGHRAFAKASSEVLVSPTAEAAFLQSSSSYYQKCGVPPSVVQEEAAIVEAIKSLAGPDTRTALRILDHDYFLKLSFKVPQTEAMSSSAVELEAITARAAGVINRESVNALEVYTTVNQLLRTVGTRDARSALAVSIGLTMRLAAEEEDRMSKAV